MLDIKFQNSKPSGFIKAVDYFPLYYCVKHVTPWAGLIVTLETLPEQSW